MLRVNAVNVKKVLQENQTLNTTSKLYITKKDRTNARSARKNFPVQVI
jgi:hypothetical protein